MTGLRNERAYPITESEAENTRASFLLGSRAVLIVRDASRTVCFVGNPALENGPR